MARLERFIPTIGMVAACVVVAAGFVPHRVQGAAAADDRSDPAGRVGVAAAPADEASGLDVSPALPGAARSPGTRPAGHGLGGFRGGLHRPGGRWHMPPPERVDEGMAFLKQNWPERCAMLERLRGEDTKGFEDAFRALWPHLARLIELSRRNPELAQVEISLVKLEVEIRQAVREVRKAAETGNAGQAEARLKELLGQRFDLDVRRTELRIQELEERLAEQRQQLEDRHQNKEALVSRAMRELIADSAAYRSSAASRPARAAEGVDPPRPTRRPEAPPGR